jgi:hypothetical protein
MSNKKAYQAALDQLESQLRQMQTPTQFENDINANYAKNRNWLVSGDLKNPQTIGFHTNLSPVANYAHQASYQVGAPNDASASGVTNPSQVYAQQLRNAANTSKLLGGAYENTASDVMNMNQGIGEEGQSLYNNRTQNLISGANSLYGAYEARPKSFWSSLATGLAGGIGSALGNL